MPTGKLTTVMITGIGGGGFGLEIFKALRLARNYQIIGVDASPLSLGLYMKGFRKTYLIPKANDPKYLPAIKDLCKKEKVNALAIGSEAELEVIANNVEIFKSEGIIPMINDPAIINLCNDKAKLFEYLKEKSVPIPKTKFIQDESDIDGFGIFPCIIKPSRESGGSRFAFLAENEEEAKFFINYLKNRNVVPLMQEYLNDMQGEYTVGILSNSQGKILGSIVLKRLLHNKLSYLTKYGDRVVSTGISQGIIDNFVELQEQAEKIAKILPSKWALNIQGRAVNDVFYPMEINPRHSGTTYLRALAGFNEPDILLQDTLYGKKVKFAKIKKGFYLRGLSELYVPFKRVKNYGSLAY